MAIDLPADSGTPIKVVAEGLVTAAGHTDINGHYVEVGHDYGWITKYRHLVETAAVAKGDVVSQGQSIGKVGSTGWSTGPHLHFDLWNSMKQSPEAVYKSGVWAHDPLLYLGQEEDDGMDEETAIRLIKAEIKFALQVDHDNREGFNQFNEDLIKTWIRALATGGSYTDEQAVKAVKDKLS
jgi:hypothetical protein